MPLFQKESQEIFSLRYELVLFRPCCLMKKPEVLADRLGSKKPRD